MFAFFFRHAIIQHHLYSRNHHKHAWISASCSRVLTSLHYLHICVQAIQVVIVFSQTNRLHICHPDMFCSLLKIISETSWHFVWPKYLFHHVQQVNTIQKYTCIACFNGSVVHYLSYRQISNSTTSGPCFTKNWYLLLLKFWPLNKCLKKCLFFSYKSPKQSFCGTSWSIIQQYRLL